MSRRAPFVTMAAIAAVTTLVHAHQTPRDAQAAGARAGTGRIAGVVVAADGADGNATTARPLRRAIVTMTGTGLGTPRQVVTDDNGRFAFASLPAGRFSLTAEKPAFLKTYYGNKLPGRAPGTPIALEERQVNDALTIPLTRGAALSGRVTDQAGAPMPAVQIQLNYVTFVNGERKLISPPSGTNMVTSDDRGEYRAYGLLPGDYIVFATGGGMAFSGGQLRLMTPEDIAAATSRASGPPPPVPTLFTRLSTYYPNAIDIAQAQPVSLGVAEDRGGIDIVRIFGTPRRSARVTGISAGPDGQPVSNVMVGLASLSGLSYGFSPGIIRPGADGAFALPPLPAGRWIIYGRGAEAGTSSESLPWWTETEFTTGEQDLSGLVMKFERGVTVTGRLVFDGTQPRPDLSRLRVTLSHLSDHPMSIPGATPRADGTFAIENVPAPGKYRAVLSTAGAWALRSAVSGDRDTLDAPFEIAPGPGPSLTLTLTDHPSEVSGILRDQLGRPAPEYSVVIFPSARALRTSSPRRNSGIVKLDTGGRYRVTGLPPGDYVLCVLTDIEPRQINDPAFLDEIAAAGLRLTLGDGEKRVQDIKIGG